MGVQRIILAVQYVAPPHQVVNMAVLVILLLFLSATASSEADNTKPPSQPSQSKPAIVRNVWPSASLPSPTPSLPSAGLPSPTPTPSLPSASLPSAGQDAVNEPAMVEAAIAEPAIAHICNTTSDIRSSPASCPETPATSSSAGVFFGGVLTVLIIEAIVFASMRHMRKYSEYLNLSANQDESVFLV